MCINPNKGEGPKTKRRYTEAQRDLKHNKTSSKSKASTNNTISTIANPTRKTPERATPSASTETISVPKSTTNRTVSKCPPQINSKKEISNFILKNINACKFIYMNIKKSDFDRAIKQLKELKSNIEHLSEKINLNDDGEILTSLNDAITILENITSGKENTRYKAKARIHLINDNLIDLHKTLNKSIKEKLLSILKRVKESLISLYESVSKKLFKKDKDSKLDTEQKPKVVDKRSTSTIENIKIDTSKIKKEDSSVESSELEDDYALSATPLEAGSISETPLRNFGATCWFNSSIKLLNMLYGKKIREKAEIKLNAATQKEEIDLYQSVIDLFEKLEHTATISTEIATLLTNMFIFKLGTQNNTDALTAICNLTKDAFVENKNKERKFAFHLGNIKQCTALEFIEAFINFMDVSDESNTLNCNEYSGCYLDTATLPTTLMSVKNKFISTNIVSNACVVTPLTLKTKTLEVDSTTFKRADLLTKLTDPGNTVFSADEKEKDELLQYLTTVQDEYIASITKYKSVFTATNLDKLKTFTMALNSQDINDRNQKNNKELDKLFDENYPYITLRVFNRQDKQYYNIKAKAVSCIAHNGNTINSGHYIACTINNKDKVIAHEDEIIVQLAGGSAGLKAALKDKAFTPVVMGYEIISKELAPKGKKK